MESKKKTKTQELEERIKRLEELQRLPYLPVKNIPKFMFDPECLHNGCGHDRNPVCHLYCPHCSPMC